MKPHALGAMEEEEIRKAYCALMQEARTRIDVLNFILRNEAQIPAMMVREICYLQFRFLCEIIAVGCLVAHGDIPATKALKKTYEPGKIISQLERLNPHFYPQPIKQTTTDQGTHKLHHIATTLDAKHLTKRELPALWGKCGSVLHRSPMVKILEAERVSPNDPLDILDWGEKLVGLLSYHWITLVDSKKAMTASLVSADTQKATVSILEFSQLHGTINIRTTFVP